MKAKSKHNIELSHYDYDANEVVQDGDVSVRAVAKAMEFEHFAEMLDNYCNTYSSGFERGRRVGKELQRTHNTIQRSIIVELVGVIAGLSDQAYTDARNADAVALAKKIAALYEQDGAGMMI